MPVPSQLGDFTRSRPAVFPLRIPAMAALIGDRRAGSQGFRPLAPLPFAADPNQRNSTDLLGFARPFLSSSLSSKPRLRAERIGGLTSLDLSTGVLGNGVPGLLGTPPRLVGFCHLGGRFPGPNDRQDSTFSRKKWRRDADAQFPADPARVRHASEGVTFSQNPTTNPNKTYDT